MNVSFNAHRGLIIVPTEIWGPTGSMVLRLALDTGATRTTINLGLLIAIGYDPNAGSNRIQITTGSGVEWVPQMMVSFITILGYEQKNFIVLGHTLPPSATVDGLLGLDFFRGKQLTLDFRTGYLTLA